MNKQVHKWIYRVAIFGNFFFLFWIMYNAIDEGFKGTLYQILSYIGLAVLLTVNAILLLMEAIKLEAR
jgi:hypothetical protein